MWTRRSFLAASTTGLITLATGCAHSGPIAKNRISKVGLQTYTLRELFEKDTLSTLQMIKEAGFDYVELNRRNFDKVPAPELRAMLDQVGLPAPASHISLEMIEGDLSELVKTSRILGLKYVIVPWINDDARTLGDWKSHANLMNKAGKRLREQGLHLAYHNHQFEFEDLGGGTTAMEIILNECDPAYLDLQLDLFWAALGDVDIPAFFKANPGRVKLCHMKDMGPNRTDFLQADYPEISEKLMLNVGEGVLPFEDYFALNDISGMEYFIAEHDSPKKPFKDAITTSYNAIKEMRF